MAVLETRVVRVVVLGVTVAREGPERRARVLLGKTIPAGTRVGAVVVPGLWDLAVV
jgi:hypothetical protein